MKSEKLRHIGKNLSLVFAGLVFAFAVLATSVWKTSAKTVNPSLKSEQVLPASVSPVPTVSPTPTVDYYLPYPGILPDHFLYPLKMLRDRITLFLITDSVKKTERLLLYADKRVGAAKALIEGGKVDLGVSTLTKGEKYLEQAITEVEKAKKANKETTSLYEKLGKATLKHQEVLTGLLLKVSGEAKEVIEKTMEYSRQGYTRMTGIKPL